ncbi:MAG: hypothetical protein ACK5NY_02440 [Burkholderiaceae bacterium]
MLAQWLIHRHMPDYRGNDKPPLDVVGLMLFGAGTALLSWLLEVFVDRRVDVTSAAVLFLLAISLIGAYLWHARQTPYPLLRMELFDVRTFRVSVLGGFVTRLGLGGVPFLLPLLYQLGLGLPAWQSGLLLMPAAFGAMGMKVLSAPVLKRCGYRNVLLVNTVLIGASISLFSLIDTARAWPFIILLSLTQGMLNAMQFSSMNSLAPAQRRWRKREQRPVDPKSS